MTDIQEALSLEAAGTPASAPPAALPGFVWLHLPPIHRDCHCEWSKDNPALIADGGVDLGCRHHKHLAKSRGVQGKRR